MGKPSLGGIPIKLIKHGPEILQFLAYINLIHFSEKRISLIYEKLITQVMSMRKGHRRICSHYRDVSVINSIACEYSKILKNET